MKQKQMWNYIKKSLISIYRENGGSVFAVGLTIGIMGIFADHYFHLKEGYFEHSPLLYAISIIGRFVLGPILTGLGLHSLLSRLFRL